MRRLAASTVLVLALIGTLGAGTAQAADPPVARVHGTVFDWDTGEPVAGVTVMVATTEVVGGVAQQTDLQQAVSGTDGSYELVVHRAGVYDLWTGQSEPAVSLEVSQDTVTRCNMASDGASQLAAWCSPPLVRVERFWSPTFNNAHFFTTDWAEADRLSTSDPNWTYEGTAFAARPAVGGVCEASEPVFRFYSQKFQSHFYTISTAEKSAIINGDPNWAYEGVAYCADSTDLGTDPLYRFWSPVFGKHFYTADAAEAAHIRAVDRNWQYEGVAFWVLPLSALDEAAL